MSTSSKEEMDAIFSAVRFASVTLKDLAITFVGSPKPKILPPDYETKIPTMDVQFPPDMLTPIANLRIPQNFKGFILKKIENLRDQLQKSHMEAYRQSCKNLLGYETIGADVLQLLRETYEARFQRLATPIILELVSSVTNRFGDTEYHLKHVAKRPFNNDFTPFLETYFQYNGYPSIAHRLIIARHSGMTPRQIEVWFQNHRNRARKEGKTVKRLLSEFPLTRAFEALPQTTHEQDDYLTMGDESGTDIVSDDAEPRETVITPSLSSVEVNPLENSGLPPAHAFPSVFDRTCSHPIAIGPYKFPPPVWPRRPAGASTKTNAAIDMTEFISMFQLKLTFLDRKRGSSPPIPSTTSPWFTSIVTIPPRGCHPALLRTPSTFDGAKVKESHPIHIPFQLPVGPGPMTTASVFQTSTLGNPLPLNHRCPTAFDQYSLPPTAHLPSRTCSSSSSVSSRSRVSSLTSRHSSPELSTPPQLPESSFYISPEEFSLDDYDFGILSFINHPDFINNTTNILDPHQALENKLPDMTTINPSLLISSQALSHSSSNHSRGYS